MASSYETSWADQWDPKPMYGQPVDRKSSNHENSTFKFSEKLDKTKAIASSSARKVKSGATTSIQWLKHKYQKTINKH
ncbi:Unknown protein [Striga hermonthica]|uniref:Uncharacterized protein n=1 Tax=Striga hermonthica TaxID=68872 RepID=A0A9N7N1X3_STRHE|nr:Unknown protein [Striga hermonthica]